MDFVILKRDSQEWINLWDKLSKHPINENIEEPNVALNNGETWQYLSSFLNEGKLVHELRHRNHPTTGRVEKIVFHGTENISDDQIDIRKKIK